MQSTDTGSDDDALAWRWHDNLIYGIRFDIGDPERRQWRSDLVFDIDYIAEWLCSAAGENSFRVAPASLVFHDVGDLKFSIDYGDSGGRNAINELVIHSVSRVRLDRAFDYWRWEVALSVPTNGLIGFCSSGFTQTMRSEPKLVAQQRLPGDERLPSPIV